MKGERMRMRKSGLVHGTWYMAEVEGMRMKEMAEHFSPNEERLSDFSFFAGNLINVHPENGRRKLATTQDVYRRECEEREKCLLDFFVSISGLDTLKKASQGIPF